MLPVSALIAIALVASCSRQDPRTSNVLNVPIADVSMSYPGLKLGERLATVDVPICIDSQTVKEISIDSVRVESGTATLTNFGVFILPSNRVTTAKGYLSSLGISGTGHVLRDKCVGVGQDGAQRPASFLGLELEQSSQESDSYVTSYVISYRSSEGIGERRFTYPVYLCGQQSEIQQCK